MACYHPNSACAIHRPGSADKICFYKSQFDAIEGKKYFDSHPDEGRYLDLPCGQCIGCRLEYSRQWMIRCWAESTMYSPDRNWWLTLTYDDPHLPLAQHAVVDPATGELLSDEVTHPLDPHAIRDFMKALRSRLHYAFGEDQVRFFGSAEYGDQSMRPHYHILLFNCVPLYPFIEFYKESNGYIYYMAKHFDNADYNDKILDLTRIWPYGNIMVTQASPQVAAYTARYMLKKHKGKDKDWYEQHGLTPVYSRQSRRPGIGVPYLKDHPEIYDYDKIILPGDLFKNSMVVRPPKSFDRIMEMEDPELIQKIKDHRAEWVKRNDRKYPSIYDKEKELETQERIQLKSQSRLQKL